MARITWIATVQIVIHPDENVETEAQACDWFHGLLGEGDEGILDWSYLHLGAQLMSPVEKVVSDDLDYEEGDAFKE